MTPNELTISDAQKFQPWTVSYSFFLVESVKNGGMPHLYASHTVLHAIKSLGKLAAVFERLDHTGKQVNVDDVLTIGKMSADLITAALRFANLYGIDIAKVLVERIEEKNGVNILESIVKGKTE